MNKSRKHAEASGAVTASDAPAGPWLGILKTCLSWTVAACVAAAVVALFVGGPLAAASVGLAALLVIAFFGISLLIAEMVGRISPGAALGAFVITYMVKVFAVGFALLQAGLPEWVDRPWFLWSALGAVVLWQAGEIRAFSKARMPIFDPDAPTVTTPKAGE